jgi:hypothetical protein
VTRSIQETVQSDDGRYRMKIYDDGAVRLELKTTTPYLLEQFWLRGKDSNLLIVPQR